MLEAEREIFVLPLCSSFSEYFSNSLILVFCEYNWVGRRIDNDKIHRTRCERYDSEEVFSHKRLEEAFRSAFAKFKLYKYVFEALRHLLS